MLWRRVFTIISSLVSLVFLTAASSNAVIKPDEILVVVNTASQDSVSLGKLYTRLRHVPPANIAKIKTTVQDDISRDRYDELIAAPLKKTINSLQNKGARIRCIVTVYGVPLRIGPQRPADISAEEVIKHEYILAQKKAKLSEMKEKPSWWNKYFKEKPKKSDIEDLENEIRKLQFELKHMQGRDTIAAVDSELALLLSPPYNPAGWQLNPEALFIRGKIKNDGRILMVSRLDAPEPGLVEKMIKAAVEVEKTGLSGKFYLDARGLTGNDAYSKFDENIRETARILQKGSMPVVLDNRPELFGTGEAPSAALYCGWYSLGEYKDAFKWVKGAVGYHVASAEAKSLHDTRHNYWVKSMLERGVIASLGPVTEPYLTAFPMPSLFFQLLMSGQYSLAEVFAMTNPYLSWQMILVGDPLYNPFKQKPAYLLVNPPPPPK
jgi:uncharacterized protein (TIGR03790 family)